MSRLQPIDPANLTPEQREVYDRIAGGARGGVRGPFLALLHSPELASRVEQLGVYVRYGCAIPERWRELAIIAVARHWRADYEWHAHAQLAARQGFAMETLEAFARGGEVDWPTPEDALIADFCSQLLARTRVGEELYGRVRTLLGEQGVTDLVGLVGYYSLLALTLNAHAIGVPEGARVPWNEP